MADRTVSARLSADVNSYVAAMRRAAAATREVSEEGERLERALQRLAREQARQTEETENQTESQRDNSQETSRNTQETSRHTRETDRNTESQERSRRAVQSSTRGLTVNRSTLISLIAGAGAMGAAVVSAGVAFTAFGALAAPAISKVVTAQQDLGKAWGTLTQQQQVSSLLVRGLTDDFKGLAKAYEPQALAAFNSLVGTGRQLLPQFGALVDRTGGDVARFLGRIGEFAEDRIGGEFLTWAGEKAPQALDVFGDTAITAGDTVLDLIQDIEPLGISLLQLTGGTLSLVNGVASVNPLLAQMAIGAVLLRSPITRLVGGVGSMGARMGGFAAATRGATLSTKALHLVKAAGPGLYVAAGVAVAFLAIKLATMKSSTDRLIESMRVEHKAVGNNVAGYRVHADWALRLADAVSKSSNAQSRSTSTTRVATHGSGQAAEAIIKTTAAQQAASAEWFRTIEKINTVIFVSSKLSGTLGGTSEEIQRMATAAGVDLSTALDKSGKISESVRQKMEQYAFAVRLAQDPTFALAEAHRILADRASTAEQKTQALALANQSALGPFLNSLNATLSLKDGYQRLIEQLGKGEAGMKGNGRASIALQQQLTGQIGTVWKAYEATAAQTNGAGKARDAAARQLPILYALAGRNTEMRRAVDALALSTNNNTGRQNISRDAFLRVAKSMGVAEGDALDLWRAYLKIPKAADEVGVRVGRMATTVAREIRKIPDERVGITVYTDGKWTKGATERAREIPGSATGGPVPAWAALGRGGPTDDDVLMWGSVGEHMIPADEVRKAGGQAGIYRMRSAIRSGELPGYAGGGAIDLRAKVPSGAEIGRAVRPVGTLTDLMVRTWAQTTAAAWKKYAGSGGPVVAAARRWIGTPYSWGGGGPGGPSRGIGRGANTVGFDCSGLTEYAWAKGRGVSIGGVTYTQHPNSSPIGSPRPAALGFSSSLGHVVLASNKPGYVIEAPFTGSHVREVRKSMPDWRWPNNARAMGGPITRDDQRLGRQFIRGGPGTALDAKFLGVAGDPGGLGIPGYAGGGWVRGAPGRDRLMLRATAGEFLVNRMQAARNPRLLEAVNSGRGGGGGTVHLHLHNDGVIGSRIEMENWGSALIDKLHRTGRLPQTTGRG